MWAVVGTMPFALPSPVPTRAHTPYITRNCTDDRWVIIGAMWFVMAQAEAKPAPGTQGAIAQAEASVAVTPAPPGFS